MTARDIVPFLLITLATAVLTWAARHYALRRRLLDHPGERRSHTVATPRGGGIAMVLSVAGYLLWWMSGHRAQAASIACGVAGLLLVAGIGWRDDHGGVAVRWRLLVHILAAACAGSSAWLASGNPLHAIAIAALALMLINAWNFMDGIDGIATLQAIVVAVAYAGLAWMALHGMNAATGLGLAIVATGLGFLPFNFPRARIFMGDVGSGALGYLLALIPAWVAVPEPTQTVGWLMPLLPFGIDTFFTLSHRMLAGEHWWTPHVTHAYQIAARRIGRHPPVSLVYAALAAALGSAAWLTAGRPAFGWSLLLGVIVLLAIVHQHIAAQHEAIRGKD